MALVKPTIGQIDWGTTLNTALDYLDSSTTSLSNTVSGKAPLASPAFTGTVTGVTKTMVGLSNVDNTSDSSKPVSTAQQTALDLKLDVATAASTYQPIGSYLTSISVASSTIIGGIKLFSDTAQTVAASSVSATASRTYGAQLNASNQLVVNVPWTDTVYTSPLTLTPNATGFSIAGGTTSKTLTVNNTLTLSGTDSSTLNIGAGGTLGTGAFATIANYAPLSSPSFTTPTLGVASATSINKLAITAPTTSATLTIADGKTATVSNTLTFSGTDGSTLNVGSGGTLGTGAFATIANYAPLSSPSFTTPTLGVASATSINKLTFTAPATSATLTIADGKTFTISNTLTLSGTDSSTLNIGTGGTLGTGAFATIANYSTLASPTFTGTVTTPILSVTSYQKTAVAAVTTPITASTYTVPDTDTFIIFDRSSAISVTFPTASSYTGRVLNLKTINTGAVTSASSNVVALASASAAATIFSANTAGKWTTLVSNGTNWVIMAQN